MNKLFSIKCLSAFDLKKLEFKFNLSIGIIKR